MTLMTWMVTLFFVETVDVGPIALAKGIHYINPGIMECIPTYQPTGDCESFQGPLGLQC